MNKGGMLLVCVLFPRLLHGMMSLVQGVADAELVPIEIPKDPHTASATTLAGLAARVQSRMHEPADSMPLRGAFEVRAHESAWNQSDNDRIGYLEDDVRVLRADIARVSDDVGELRREELLPLIKILERAEENDRDGNVIAEQEMELHKKDIELNKKQGRQNWYCSAASLAVACVMGLPGWVALGYQLKWFGGE